MAGFWNGAGAGAIAGVGNIVGSVLSAAMQNRYNQQAYERQSADALAQWRRQNAYDSPAAQMQRFREAGLNPDLIYGQMSQGSTMDSNASLSQVAPDFSQVGSVVSNAMFASRQVQTQQDMADAQINLLNAQADAVRGQEGRADESHPWQLKLYEGEVTHWCDVHNFQPYQISNIVAQTDQLRQSAFQLKSSAELLGTEKMLKEVDLKWKNILYDDQHGLNVATIKELESRYSLNRSQVLRTLRLLPFEISAMVANTELANANKNLALADIDYRNTLTKREEKLLEGLTYTVKEQAVRWDMINPDNKSPDSYNIKSWVFSGMNFKDRYWYDSLLEGTSALDDIFRTVGGVIGAVK